MCDTCGCNVTAGNRHLLSPGGRLEKTADGKVSIKVLQGLLSENDHQAAHNREHFDRHGVLAINLMSSPGAGKTSLLEATIDALGQNLCIAVIEGDLETENDAERIRAKGVDAVQITTGSACHLDAHMVHDALHQMNLNAIDVLFIENVGNLVCPASFDLGQHLNITLLSVPEGDDKPAKYPVIFRAADTVLITKTDLLPYLKDFKLDRAERYIRDLASDVPQLSVSAANGEGLEDWFTWLQNEMKKQQQRLESGQSRRPAIQPDGLRRHKLEAQQQVPAPQHHNGA